MGLLKILTTIPTAPLAFKVLGGDFPDGHVLIEGEYLRAPGTVGRFWIKNDVASIERVAESNYEKVTASLGWAVAGAAVFGPLGLLAGPVMKRRETKTRVVFLVAFHDGRKLLGEGDEAAWLALGRARWL